MKNTTQNIDSVFVDAEFGNSSVVSNNLSSINIILGITIILALLGIIITILG